MVEPLGEETLGAMGTQPSTQEQSPHQKSTMLNFGLQPPKLQED